jgi:hypothetical protein
MKCCNIKWTNNKHWFNINQILHLISVKIINTIVLTLIHSKSIQHCIYIVPYKLYKIYLVGCVRCIPSVRKTISNFFIFSFPFFFFPSPSLLPYLHCTMRLFIPVPFSSLCFSWSSHSLHFVLRARRRECRARCKFIFWRNKERSIVSFLCYCCCWE